jgi:AcrR family transcriptional regulator
MTERRAARAAEAARNDRALLEAARDVLSLDGAHASVAAIAKRAGVGIGSLYRRYRSKEELFQHLAVLAVQQWNEAAERGLAAEDPWAGLAGFVTECVESGQGSLAPVAGTIEVTPEMWTASTRGDELLAELVARAHAAGMLRPDATAVDVSLLIEQLRRSPLVDQVRAQGRDDLVDEAVRARRRVIAIALDGLRAGPGPALPGEPPSLRLFTERWEPGTS